MIGMLASGFVAFLAAPNTAFAAAPAIRNGDACKKVGKKITEGNKTFECVERNGVRVWQRAKSSGTPTSSTTTVPTTNEVKVLDSAQLALGASLTAIATSGGSSFAVVVTRTAGGVVAFSRTCTHLGSLVVPRGSDQLYCPAHGSIFNASSGAVIEGPANRALTQYKATERGGSIYITV
jgi:Rieske Fe-S protein